MERSSIDSFKCCDVVYVICSFVEVHILKEANTMCGGIYEEDLKEDFATEYKKKPMGDIKFMTAGDFMSEQKEDDGYYTPGGDCQE
jgi:hypothetical protein